MQNKKIKQLLIGTNNKGKFKEIKDLLPKRIRTFSTLKFKGADVVADSHCPDGVMLFLNTKYLDFKVHSKRNFSFQDFQKPINQDARTAKIFWMGQLVCTNPRMQGMIVGGPSGYTS